MDYNEYMTTSHLTPDFIARMKQKLLAEKAKLETELAGLHMHTEVGTQTDENAEEIELDEVSQNLIARLQADLKKISAALRKIDDGTYGTDASGKPIAKARLAALPWADTAI